MQAEAVANDKHTLYLIAEAADEQQLRRYLAPFYQSGPVEVLPAPPARRASIAAAARRRQPGQKQRFAVAPLSPKCPHP